MTRRELKRLNKLYKYCTTTRVHGALYRVRLRELQILTVKALTKETYNAKEKSADNTDSHV